MPIVEALNCPKCGAAIEDENATKCEYCGTTLRISSEGSKKKSARSGKAGLPDYRWICPGCGFVNRARKERCWSCKRPVDANPKEAPESNAPAPDYSWICPACSKHNPPGIQYCRKCGSAAGLSPAAVPKTQPRTSRSGQAPSVVPRRPRRQINFGKALGSFVRSAFWWVFMVVMIGGFGVGIPVYHSLPLPLKARVDTIITNFPGAITRLISEKSDNDNSSSESLGEVRVLAGWNQPLREQPTISSTQIGELRPNETLSVLEISGEWYRVRTADGRIGWVQIIIRGTKVIG